MTPDQTAVEWAVHALGGSAEAEPLRDRPWSSTWRIRSSDRTPILKATGPASHYEAGLVYTLAQAAPSYLPPVIACEPDQGWLLMEDAGPTFRAAAAGDSESWDVDDWDLGTWTALVGRFARLQRIAEPLVDDLLAFGVPDERPDQLPAIVQHLLAESANLRGLTHTERGQAATLPSSWEPDLALLRRSAIPASVQHGDLHHNNASPSPAGPVFFDFGDASIAHPFTTMWVPMLMARQLGAPQPDLEKLGDAYLSEFTDVASMRELRLILDAALRLAPVNRVTSWDRALSAAPSDHGWGEPVLATLRQLLQERAIRLGQ